MNTSRKNYNHQNIELKWQTRWAKDKLYKVDPTIKKFALLSNKLSQLLGNVNSS